MNPRTTILSALAFVLLAFVLVGQPALAEATSQCQVRPLCSAQSADGQADLQQPASQTATAMPPFALQLIGDCCPNNDASLCPAKAGYSKVVCGFPMCSSGLLSCIYSN